jgi:hypothetical protein
MYKLWYKRVYTQSPGIGESTPETVVELIQSEINVVRFHNTFLPHNCVSLTQYLEFWGKLFCATLYTYCVQKGQSEDKSCRMGCKAIEDMHHIFVNCPEYSKLREEVEIEVVKRTQTRIEAIKIEETCLTSLL